MRTRRGQCYPKVHMCRENDNRTVKRAVEFGREQMGCQKRLKVSPEIAGKYDFFDVLPDDLVLSILCKLSSTAGSPTDFTNVLITYEFLSFDLFLDKEMIFTIDL